MAVQPKKTENAVSENKSEEIKSKKETTKVKKESVNNGYIHIDNFFSKRKIDQKYVVPFSIFMKGNTYQHSLSDFDKYFRKFLNRFKR